jgi:two-component system cell cycle sensor histidine kinase/response regulator CckA
LGAAPPFPVSSLDSDQSPNPIPPRPIPVAGASILLVEDEPAVRNITARILRRQGYLVMEAPQASEARAINAATAQIDLLLTDLVMPEMSGIQLADELALSRPGLKVLYMTGYAGALREPTQRVLQKPFTSDALLDHVAMALREEAPAA